MPLNIWLVNVWDIGHTNPRSTGEWYFRVDDADAAVERLKETGRYHRVEAVGPVVCDVDHVSPEVVDDWCQRR